MKRFYWLLLMGMVTVAAHATVIPQFFVQTYTCTGSTGPFPFNYPLSAPPAMTVTKNGVPVSSTAYSIVPINNNYDNGGSITLNTACPAGQTLILKRATPLTQTTVFTDNMPIPMKAIENGLDKLTEIMQEEAVRSINIADGFISGDCPNLVFTGGQWVFTDSGGPCGTAGPGGGGCSTGGIATTNGSVTGDLSSTNCGYNNRVGDTATSPALNSTFGSNLLATNSGSGVVAVGTNVGASNSGSEVVMIGDTAGTNNGAAHANFIGQFSGAVNAGQSVLGYVDCLGYGTCRNMDGGGQYFVGIGYQAISGQTGMDNVIGIGNTAAVNRTSGNNIIGIGQGAAIGQGDLTPTTGSNIIGIGNAGASGSGGSDIVGIGRNTCTNLGTGSSDVYCFGRQMDSALANITNAMGFGHNVTLVSNQATFGLPVAIVDSTRPSQMSMTYSVGHAPVPAAGSAVFAPDPSGNATVAENGAAVSRICTAANSSGVTGCGTGGGGGSPVQVSIATVCAASGAQADLNTGLTPSGGAAGDYSTCINTQAALAAASTLPTELLIDGSFKAAVVLPKAGNVTMRGQGGGMNRVLITAYSITSNVVTFTTLPQNLQVNNTVMLGTFGTSTFLNASAVKVLSSTSTSFTANLTHVNASATENGEADYLWGTGLIAPTGADNSLIDTAGGGANCFTDSGTVTPGPAPGRGSNLIISDMVLNGWGLDLTGAIGNSTFGNRAGNAGTPYSGPYTSHQCLYNNLNIRDMENVVIDNVYAINPPAHVIDLSNVGHVRVTNSDFEGWYPNLPVSLSDGIHIDGPSNDIFISNITCFVYECLANNAPEGWSGGITGVTIDGLVDNGSNSIARLYAGSVAPPAGTATAFIDGWTATNIISNQPTSIPFIIGAEVVRTPTVAEAVRNVKVTNSVIQSPYFATLADNYGILEFSHITWKQNACTTSPVGMFAATVNPVTGTALQLNDIKVQRTVAGGACFLGALNTVSGGYGGAGVSTTLGTLDINGFGIIDQGGSHGSTAELINLDAGSTVGPVNLTNVDWANIAAPASSLGTIGYIGTQFNQVGSTNKTPCARFQVGTSVLCPGLTYEFGIADPVTAAFSMEETTAPLDQKRWDFLATSSAMVFRAINDANSAATNWLTVNRTGSTITDETFSAKGVFPNLTDSALTSGNCVQASTGGLLTTTAGPCGGGSGLIYGTNAIATAATPVIFDGSTTNNQLFKMTSAHTSNTSFAMANTSTGGHSWSPLVGGSAGTGVGMYAFLDNTTGFVPIAFQTTSGTAGSVALAGASLLGWNNGNTGLVTTDLVTAFTNMGGGTVNLGTGTSGSSAGRLNLTTLAASGAVTGTTLTPVYNATGTLQSSSHIVNGSGTLSGSTLAVTLSGSAVFTSSSSFSCTANSTDNTTIAFGFTYASGSSFSVFGSAATTPFRYSCIGN